MLARNLCLLLSLMALAWSAVACTGSAPITQAESDANSIVVYTARSTEDAEHHLAIFQAQYPHIAVHFERDQTGKITDRFLAEKSDPQADVIWGLAATSLLQAVAEGMLEPYAPAGLDRVHPRMQDPSNDPPLFTGIDVYMSAFCVNTALLAEKGLAAPASWADLIKPEYQGYLSMPDPTSSGTGFIAVAAVLQLYGENEGWAYLDKLHQNMVVYTKSGSQPCKLAAAGQIPIGISLDSEAIKPGPPILAVFPNEGSGWELEANALVKKSVIKDAAKTFLDWAISDSAMRDYADRGFLVTSVTTDVPRPENYVADPIGQLIPDWRFVWLTANRNRILEDWARRYGDKSELQKGDIPDALRQ